MPSSLTWYLLASSLALALSGIIMWYLSKALFEHGVRLTIANIDQEWRDMY